ncbi:MAG: 1-acyl-sn-glycerol-3-phosphate acyltransferase [Nannocystis sp.]|nr:1-acyl-sn-glycerol-3-phosphate acyltransferase [Nannocystis sp.]
MSRLASLRRVARAAGALAWTAAEFVALEAKLLAQTGDVDAEAERELQRWCRGLLRLGGIELRIDGACEPARRGRLVIANHRSAYDIVILYALFGGSMLSRAEVAGWPIFGHAARRSQTIFVDRSSPQSGFRAIRSIREALQRGRTVTVFPEGTTFAGDDLRPFAAGAFAAARGLDVDVVPVGLAYPAGTEYVEDSILDHITNLTGRRRVPVGVAIGAARRPEGKPDRLLRECEAEVTSLIARARARL